MAVQRLGPKKHRKCEALAGRSYSSCWTRGGWEHFVAECQWPAIEGDKRRNSDLVNWKTGKVQPAYRDGLPAPRTPPRAPPPPPESQE